MTSFILLKLIIYLILFERNKNNITNDDGIFTESNDRKYYIKVNESDGSTYFLKTVSGAGESPIWVKVD